MKYSSYKKFEWKAMTLGLFLICFLQVMILGFLQMSDHSLGPQMESRIIPLNAFLYLVILVTSVFHPTIMRCFTLKFALLAGLLCDLLGASLLLVNETIGGMFLLMLMSFFFLGIAIVSVVNCLVTYLVIEFPRSLGFAMIGLFLFANLGMATQTALLTQIEKRSLYPIFCLIGIALVLLAMGFVYAQFFNPIVPKHLVHLRRGSLIWKEFHYRMGLFIFAMLSYGIIETVFGAWANIYLLNFISAAEAKFALTSFWGSMVIGQIALLAPMYFYPARKIFSLLLIYAIGVTLFLERQTEAHQLIAGSIAAGFGCSIIFPLLLSFFEKEVMQTCALSKIESPIAFIETGISLMVGGYLTGVGIVSLCILKLGHEPALFTQVAFHRVILLLVGIGLISTYLNWSSGAFKDENSSSSH